MNAGRNLIVYDGRFDFFAAARVILDTAMRNAIFLTLLLAAGLPGASPELKRVQSIYVTGMGSGLDQYLVNRLVKAGQFTIVGDPQKADAIFTDSVGENTQAKLDALLNPEKEEKAEDKDNSPAKTRLTAFSKGRGTVFLIDRQSRNVLWSTFARPSRTTPEEMVKVADTIASRLEKDHQGKK